MIVASLYGVSLCLLMPSVLCIGGFGELGEHTSLGHVQLQHHQKKQFIQCKQGMLCW